MTCCAVKNPILDFLTRIYCDMVSCMWQVVGDDLLCTNPKTVQKAIEKKACNALLLKINQVGTITESIEAVRIAKVPPPPLPLPCPHPTPNPCVC